MKNFRDSLKEEMKNPEFKKEWDALESEFKLARENLKCDEENFSKALTLAVMLNNSQVNSQCK